jgi:hypothetical protein
MKIEASSRLPRRWTVKQEPYCQSGLERNDKIKNGEADHAPSRLPQGRNT